MKRLTMNFFTIDTLTTKRRPKSPLYYHDYITLVMQDLAQEVLSSI